ncbi:shikimate kinase [Alteribacter lacisalsi]|uniref:Shikimate kinase n=1 Tax=Alteribacter lacisalsi TaxID=2045244 RepID=A0A2W0H9S3_9BACI|nr:shikimate kinase [Alteribacter lacisalsi]PYZ98604.1 shikimate kinase [Alteribacter lacisalsi]
MTMQANGNIYLTGFMGAGKTTVGKLLARKNGLGFIDLDDVIVKQTGKSIPDIFRNEGEEWFRKVESQVLERMTGKRAVISTGGGAVEKEENVAFMRKTGLTFFLDAPFDVLYERIKADPGRPLAGIDRTKLEERYSGRRKAYATADVTIQTMGLTPREIVKAIVEAGQPL